MPALLRWFLRLGPTNPVAVRLVQNGSTRTRHLYIRTGYLATLIGVLLWSLLAQSSAGALSYRDLAAAGAESFAYTAYLQIGLICVLAPLFMAGAIAQEANPRTWDILLTTPLSAAQIVLGNLFGRLFFILALLISSLPLFAITQYFGGVPGSTILKSYAVAACAALLVGAIAIAMSVSRLAGRRAVFVFYIAVISYLAVTWAIDQGIRAGGVTVMTPLNPFLAQESLLNPSSYPTPDPTELVEMGSLSRLWYGSPVLAWCLWSSLLSVALMGAGASVVRAIAAEGGAPWRKSLSRFELRQRARGLRSVWKNPVAWREAAARATTLPKRAARWSFVALGVVWGLVILWLHFKGTINGSTLRFMLLATLWTELAVISLIAMNMAATSVSREREDGTLDLLLTTPITPKAYLGGKLRGIISFLVPLAMAPLLTGAFAAVYILANGFGAAGGVTVPDVVGTTPINTPIMLPAGALVLPLVFAPFLAFCVMVGLQWSVKSKGAIGSAVATVGVVGAIAGVLGLCGAAAGPSIPFLGPMLTTLNPATAIYAMCDPARGASETLSGVGGQQDVTLALLTGAGASAVVYGVVVWAILTSMVRSFDMTVRRLAGTR
ncbi:MAG: ABC transporter permease [Phycisphaerales bacterium]